MDGVDYAYRLAEREIAHRITSGLWPYGTKLPSRERLAAEIGYGVMTVRRALGALADPERAGGPMIRSLPGSGTWVIWQPPAA